MNRRRLVLVGVVVAALVGLVAFWGGRTDPVTNDVARPDVPTAGSKGELSSTWFCAAGALAADQPARHTVFLANPTSRSAVVTLNGFSQTARLGAKQVLVGPTSSATVDVDELFGAGTSVMAESPVAPLSVAHRLQTSTYADQVACATATSDRWYFLSQSTVRGAGATLVLFNPFSVDAGADVRIGLDGGVRSPRALNGIVVPAGQTRYVALGESVQRRDAFTATVQMRSGRLVAETVQLFDGSNGPRGMRMQLGVPAARDRWSFAGGFTGANAAERVVLHNPGRSTVTALVQVTPYGAVASPPDPFEVEVPPLRFTTLDLGAESRVPGVGYHAVDVESDAPVVVARTNTLSGAPGGGQEGVPTRPGLSRGTAVGTGTPVQATDWLLPGMRTGPSQRSVVLVHNTSAGIALLKVSLLLEGKRVVPDGFERYELASGDSVLVPVGPAGVPDGSVSVQVESSTPVVVEGLSTFFGTDDLAMDLGIPLPGGPGSVDLLAGG
jgi:hypothetical protein